MSKDYRRSSASARLVPRGPVVRSPVSCGKYHPFATQSCRHDGGWAGRGCVSRSDERTHAIWVAEKFARHPLKEPWDELNSAAAQDGFRLESPGESRAVPDHTAQCGEVLRRVPGHRVDVGALGDLVPTDHTPGGG